MLLNYLEITVFRLAIKLLKADYGERCESKDLDDFPHLKIKETSGARCPACKAWETIDFLEDHISLIREN